MVVSPVGLGRRPFARRVDIPVVCPGVGDLLGVKSIFTRNFKNFTHVIVDPVANGDDDVTAETGVPVGGQVSQVRGTSFQIGTQPANAPSVWEP